MSVKICNFQKHTDFEKKSWDKNKKYCSKESQTESECFSKCGDIFISANDELLLNCNFCDKNTKILDTFWDHLLEEHSFVTNKIKLEIQLKHEDSVRNFNSDISSVLDGNEHQNQDSGSSVRSNEDDPNLEKCIANIDSKTNKDAELQNAVLKIDKISTKNSNKNEEHNIQKGYWQCDICQLILKKGKERKLHEKTHCGLKKLICETCGKGYTTRRRLLDHMRTHTGEKPFKCRFCPKTFFSKSGLKSHDKTHIGVKPFKCEYCDHHFKTKYNKQIHEQNRHKNSEIIEEKERGSHVTCKLCNKSFKCSEYLVKHLKRHEENLTKSSHKPFECSFCPSTFLSNFNRNAHERLCHKGEYNYKCDFCGKAFLKLSRKRQHEEMHTRVENPHKCDLCERSYARSITLKKHKIAKHTKDSPHYCKICRTRFESIILFKEHCKQHYIEEKLHGCKYCEARFDTEIILDRHINKMHHKVEKQRPN